MIVMEEWNECVFNNINTYLEKRMVDTMYEMATLTDECALMYKCSKLECSNPFKHGSSPGP